MQPHSRQLRLLILLHLFALILFITGCSYLGFPTYYDPTTFKNLTDLKPEVIALYNTFAADSVDSDKIDAVRLKLAQAYEYEKGKGDKNRETWEQVAIVQKMFERHVRDRMENGKWNKTHLNNKKEIISEAFDIAIKTERLKNKNE